MKRILAALTATFISLFVSNAFAQPKGPANEQDGGACVDQSARVAKLEGELADCQSRSKACTNLDTIKKELEEAKAEAAKQSARAEDCEKKLVVSPTPAPAKPVTPLKLLCEEGTTGTPNPKTGHCECDAPGKVLLTGRFGGNVKVEVCLSTKQQVETLLNVYVTQAEFNEAMKKLRDGQMTREMVIAIIKEVVPNLEPRVKALEDGLQAERERNDGQDWEINRLKRSRKYGLEFEIGGFAALATRGNFAFPFGLASGITGRFSDRVGITGRFRAGAVYEVNTKWMAQISGVVGPIFDLTDTGSVRLYVGPSFVQYAKTNHDGGLEGNAVGGSYGGEIGLPIMLGDAPLALTPFANLGGGPVNRRNDAGTWQLGSAFQVNAGLSLTLVAGLLPMGKK